MRNWSIVRLILVILGLSAVTGDAYGLAGAFFTEPVARYSASF